MDRGSILKEVEMRILIAVTTVVMVLASPAHAGPFRRRSTTTTTRATSRSRCRATVGDDHGDGHANTAMIVVRCVEGPDALFITLHRRCTMLVAQTVAARTPHSGKRARSMKFRTMTRKTASQTCHM
jgi:hypothetical protein